LNIQIELIDYSFAFVHVVIQLINRGIIKGPGSRTAAGVTIHRHDKKECKAFSWFCKRK